MENLFKKNQIILINFNELEPKIFDLNKIDFNDIKNIIDNNYDENEPINIFGNIDNNDFFRTNVNYHDLNELINNNEALTNWNEIVEKFQEEFENNIYDFQFDDYDLGEFTYTFNPYGSDYGAYGDEDELTEEGWKNLSENFINILNETILDKYPISIVSTTIDDYDEYEYNEYLKIRFEIHPFVKNLKIIK